MEEKKNNQLMLEELEKLPVIEGQYSIEDILDGVVDMHDKSYGEFAPTVRYIEADAQGE